MNTRIVTAVTAVTLLALTGCNGGLRNFAFGRGAACGACAATGPQFDIAPPAPWAPPVPGYAPTPCGSGYGGDCEHGGINAYAPPVGVPYGEGVPGVGADYLGNGYSYPAPVPENWVPAGEALVPGSAYMSEPLTPMAPPAL